MSKLLCIFITIAALASPAGFAQTKKASDPPQRKATPAPAKSEPAKTEAPAKQNEAEPPNAGLCRDLEQRAAGWDRTVIQFAKSKNTAEIELLNCKAEEKDHKTLPHQCDQYQEQIVGWERDLKKAEHEKETIRDLWTRYKCQ
jgi:hypothetical protein